eukprot:UN26878
MTAHKDGIFISGWLLREPIKHNSEEYFIYYYNTLTNKYKELKLPQGTTARVGQIGGLVCSPDFYVYALYWYDSDSVDAKYH